MLFLLSTVMRLCFLMISALALGCNVIRLSPENSQSRVPGLPSLLCHKALELCTVRGRTEEEKSWSGTEFRVRGSGFRRLGFMGMWYRGLGFRVWGFRV